MLILGIDPGVDPALALYDPSTDALSVQDGMVAVLKGKTKPLPEIIKQHILIWDPGIAVLEDVSAMPKQGVTSTFNFGRAAGLLHGICIGLGVRVELVRPTEWKATMRVGRDKDAARQIAMKRWPCAAADFSRKKDHNRAEAALLALYGAHRFGDSSWNG